MKQWTAARKELDDCIETCLDCEKAQQSAINPCAICDTLSKAMTAVQKIREERKADERAERHRRTNNADS